MIFRDDSTVFSYDADPVAIKAARDRGEHVIVLPDWRPKAVRDGDKYALLEELLAEATMVCKAYQADRWSWLPWRDYKWYRRIREARLAYRTESKRLGLWVGPL